MLRGSLIHPQILSVLGRAGHGSQILIADGNYPFGSAIGPKAELISLNLAPGVVSCTDVLAALLPNVPIERLALMDYARSGPYGLSQDPPIWAEYQQLLDRNNIAVAPERIERFAFYEAARSTDVVATIATAEQRIYANILLTIGVVFPHAT